MDKIMDIFQIKNKILFLFFTIVVSSCSKTIEVPSPIADFSFAGGIYIAPCEVQIKNVSTNSTTFSWDFGDGTVSTDKDPKHLYHRGGKYNIKLIAKGDGGISSTYKSIIIGIQPDPIPDFSFTNGDLYISTEIVFMNKSINSDTYLWDFGDGSTSTDKEPKHIFNKKGSYIITLTASSTIGVKKSITKTIELKSNSYNKTGFVHKKRWGFKKLIYLFYESKINL
jgi:PKD repeat protein